MAQQPHILIAQPGLQSFDGLLSMVGFREMFRVSRVADGADAMRLIAQKRPDAAFLDVLLPGVAAADVAEYAASHSVPTVFLARKGADLSRLKSVGFPLLAEPVDEHAFIATVQALLAESAANLAQMRAGVERLRLTQRNLSSAIEQSRAILDKLRRDKTQPLHRDRARLDDWDVVRAAQGMIEQHGDKAAATADARSENAVDLNAVRCWRTIAETIRALQGRA